MLKRILCISFLFASTLQVQAGNTVQDYIAASTKYVAALAADIEAGASEDDLFKADSEATADLKKRMMEMVGPVSFDSFGDTPDFTPATLMPDNIETGALDGIRFDTEDGAKSLIVTPLPILEHWLQVRSLEAGAPESFKQGVEAALTRAPDDLYTYSFSNDNPFTRFVDIPVKSATPNEKLYAALGTFSKEDMGIPFPGSIVVTRIADGRVEMANKVITIKAKPIATCHSAWKKASANADALQKQIEKDQIQEDPRWEEQSKMQEEAHSAFRACFSKEAPIQPFFANVIKDTESLVGELRAN